MGIFDFVKKQFVDVIQWTEDGDGVLAYRYPMMDMEIQYGAQLTVRDSQSALFIDEGIIADSFSPGLHTLNTKNLPLLTNLKHWDKLFESPFKSDVIFFSNRLQLDRKWGTSNPITLRDPEFGVVRLRAFGIYSYHLSDTTLFYKEVCGTRGTYTVDELDGQLRHLMIAELTQLFANSQVSFIDMAANQGKLAESLRTQMTPIFARYGLKLDNLALENISLPEDLQTVLDKRIGMNMVGDLNRYTQYQVADAIPLAAQNESGIAGAGAGMGAGFAIAQNMAQAMSTPGNNGLTPSLTAASQDDIIATIEKLHGLVVKGVLTQAEFDVKKAELLSQLK